MAVFGNGDVELSAETEQAIKGGLLERWRDELAEFVQFNQRRKNDTLSLQNDPVFFYSIFFLSRASDVNLKAAIPQIIE